LKTSPSSSYLTFARGGVHHEDQLDGDRIICCTRLELVPETDDTWKDLTPANADEHGQQYT